MLLAFDHLGEFKSHLLQLFEDYFSPVHLLKSCSKFNKTLNVEINFILLFKVGSCFVDLETMIGQPQKLIDNAKKVRVTVMC